MSTDEDESESERRQHPGRWPRERKESTFLGRFNETTDNTNDPSSTSQLCRSSQPILRIASSSNRGQMESVRDYVKPDQNRLDMKTPTASIPSEIEKNKDHRFGANQSRYNYKPYVQNKSQCARPWTRQPAIQQQFWRRGVKVKNVSVNQPNSRRYQADINNNKHATSSSEEVNSKIPDAPVKMPRIDSTNNANTVCFSTLIRVPLSTEVKASAEITDDLPTTEGSRPNVDGWKPNLVSKEVGSLLNEAPVDKETVPPDLTFPPNLINSMWDNRKSLSNSWKQIGLTFSKLGAVIREKNNQSEEIIRLKLENKSMKEEIQKGERRLIESQILITSLEDKLKAMACIVDSLTEEKKQLCCKIKSLSMKGRFATAFQNLKKV